MFKSYIIFEFNQNCSTETKHWFENKLKYDCDLLTKFTENNKNQEVFLNVSASTKRLLIGAEEINLRKRYKSGVFREFVLTDLENFQESDNLENFLTQSECLRIIDNILSNLNTDTVIVPGTSNVKLYQFDSIINQLRNHKIISNVFPLHDRTELIKLESDWYKTTKSFLFSKIPIDKIRNYFGESITFYFSFLEFYTFSLFPVAVIGLLTWLLPLSAFTRFAICGLFNLIWSTVFMELWKRRSSELSYNWGVFDTELFEKQRPQFHGELAIDPVTNQPQLQYSKKKRMLKKYLVSYPSVGVSIFIAFSLMMIYYHYQYMIDDMYNKDTYLHVGIRMVPSFIYSFVVIPLNIIYKLIATWLTEWENHRTNSSFESNLATKLFLFYFANSFMSLFYEAFFNRNFDNLSNLLISMVIVNALLNKLSETIGPYIIKKIRKFILKRSERETKINVSQIEKEAYTLEQFDGVYSDYVTVFEQYGYIALFSAVFPWISIAAFANNIMELKSDAFKYCQVFNRPFPRLVHGIGPWYNAFEILGFVAVLTNLSLVAVHPDVRNYFSSYSDKEYLMLFVIAEHLIIVLKILIMFLIPDESLKVTSAKLRYKYDSIQALKKERQLKINKNK